MPRVTLILVLALLSPALQAQQHDPSARQSALATLTRSIDSAPADQRLAYNALFVAFTTFREAHLRHEMCLDKQPCFATHKAENERLEEEFVKLGYGFAPAQAPSFSPEALLKVDQALNDKFKRITDTLPESCSASDCTSRATERDVQRDWIRYRDAWTTFGTMRFPSISSETWRAYLTIQRDVQLLTAFNEILQKN